MAEDDKPAKGPKPDRPAKGPGGDKAAAAKGPKGPRDGKGAPKDKAAAPKEKVARAPRPKDYKPRLKTHYEKVVREEMVKQFGYKNRMQIPRIEKIVLNMGVGEAVNDRKKAEVAAADLSMIAGQKAIVTYSRIAISTFKLR